MNHDETRTAAAEAACGPSEPVPYTYNIWSFGSPLKATDDLNTLRQRHHRGRCNPLDCQWCIGPLRPAGRPRPWRESFVAHLANPDWQDDAACAGAAADLWFPEHGEGKSATAKQAKAVCADCPVQRECLHYALYNNEKYGVWGGLTERERRRIGQRQRRMELTE